MSATPNFRNLSGNHLCSGLACAMLMHGLAACAPARADEALFGYMYSTDSLPKGQWEFEQIMTARSGKARGSYFALDMRHEVEYGISDRFSAALYLNSGYNYIQNLYNPEDTTQNVPDVNTFDLQGMSLEFKYRLLSPYTDPLGLSLYFEPEFEVRDSVSGEIVSAKAFEFRLIFQKNFMDDTLVFVSNLMLEPEWEKVGDESLRELFFEFTLGGSYRIQENWYLGLEFRNHREFPDLDWGAQEHSAYFLGPNVHYGTKDWWATLTILPQISGTPGYLGIGADGQRIDGGSLHLAQHEKLEVRLKLGFNL
ncbi:MAG: DUF6662 family protein [Bacteriovoracia bacterium]